MNHETFLTTFDVAKALDVSPATVRLWNRLGKLPAIRTQSGIRLFSRDDVESFASKRRALKERHNGMQNEL